MLPKYCYTQPHALSPGSFQQIVLSVVMGEECFYLPNPGELMCQLGGQLPGSPPSFHCTQKVRDGQLQKTGRLLWTTHQSCQSGFQVWGILWSPNKTNKVLLVQVMSTGVTYSSDNNNHGNHQDYHPGLSQEEEGKEERKEDGSSHLIPIERIIKFASGNFD